MNFKNCSSTKKCLLIQQNVHDFEKESQFQKLLTNLNFFHEFLHNVHDFKKWLRVKK